MLPACVQRPPWQLQTLLRRHQLPPLLLMVLITVLAEFMGANAMRLYGRNLWDVLHSSLHGFALQQIEDACYLLGELAAPCSCQLRQPAASAALMSGWPA